MPPDNTQNQSDIASLPAVQPPTPAQAVATVAVPPNQDTSNLKMWLQNLQNILAKTTGDPSSQSKEIAKLRAAYISKKYGRPKLPEDGVQA